MFIQKLRRTSSKGIKATPYSYSNTNQTDNTPVTVVTDGGDLNHLSPTLTQPPIAPDTITPQLTPDTDRINLMLPVSGFVGTVYVVLTKATPNAAIVVVEVTNDKMDYNVALDTTMLDDPTPPPPPPNPEPNKPYYSAELNQDMLETLRFQLEYMISYDCLLSYEPTPSNVLNQFKEIYTPYVKETAYRINDDNNIPTDYGFYSISSYTRYHLYFSGGEVSFVNSFSVLNGASDPPLTKDIDLGTFDIINPRYIAYHHLPQRNDFGIPPFVDRQLGYGVIWFRFDSSLTKSTLIGVLFQAETVFVSIANICLPVIDTDAGYIDWGTFKIVKTVIETITDEPKPTENKPPKIPVRRGYINIGGKLEYLYSVKKETPTEVFANHNGSNYGLIVNTPDRTKVIKQTSLMPNASFNNNVNGINLTPEQQALLEQCLPVPDDTLQGGFKAMNGATEINFNSYGFESIFYQTPTKYNNTTLKACAVYGV